MVRVLLVLLGSLDLLVSGCTWDRIPCGKSGQTCRRDHYRGDDSWELVRSNVAGCDVKKEDFPNCICRKDHQSIEIEYNGGFSEEFLNNLKDCSNATADFYEVQFEFEADSFAPTGRVSSVEFYSMINKTKQADPPWCGPFRYSLDNRDFARKRSSKKDVGKYWETKTEFDDVPSGLKIAGISHLRMGWNYEEMKKSSDTITAGALVSLNLTLVKSDICE